MKSRAAVLLVLSLLAVPPLFADNPAVPDHVVLNFDEFMKLWTQAQTPVPTPDKPPMDAAITRISYVGAVGRHSTDIEATFDLSVFAGEKWVRLPFLPSAVGLREAQLDGAAVPIVAEGGMHALLLKGAGHHTLRAVFSVATEAGDGNPRFSFHSALAPITLMTLNFTETDVDVRVEPAQALSLRREKDGTVAQAILPATQNIRVSWNRRAPAEVARPAQVYARLRQLLSVEEAALRLTADISYTILHSAVNEVTLRVPEGLSILNVTGEDVGGWRMDKTRLHVRFDRAYKGERLVRVQAERALTGDGSVAAPLLSAEDVVRQEGAVAVDAMGNAEVAVNGLRALRQVDVKELPAELWALARNPLLFGFTATQGAGGFDLAITRHEDIAVLNSTVDSANALTVLTKDGQSVTRVSFAVRNHLKQFLTLNIPEGAEIWSAFVNGRPVKPSRGKNGEVLIPLDKSGFGAVDAAFPVEVVYHAKSSPLGWAGQARALLPQIDLPVSELLWSVYAPEAIRLVRANGNVEATAAPLMPAAGVDMESIRREAKDDREGYVARATKALRGRSRQMAADAVERQVSMELSVAEADAPAMAPLENHVLPVAFRIPETGRLYRFGKIMVTGEAPFVSMTYVKSGFLEFLKGMLLAALGVLMFLRRREIAEALRRMKPALGEVTSQG